MSINRVILTGRLTKDVDLRLTQNSLEVASFNIAVDSYSKNQNDGNQTSFISCVAWGQIAKYLSDYCGKGILIAVDGKLQTRSYDRKDGTKVFVTEVIADRVERLTPRGENDNIKNENVSNKNDDNSYLKFDDENLPF